MVFKSNFKRSALPAILQSRAGLRGFFMQTLVNTLLLFIGLILPGFWLGRILFIINILPFYPEYHHLYIAIGYAAPIGALLYLMGVRDPLKRFGIVMLYLAGYGALLPVVIGAILRMIIYALLYFFLSYEYILVITGVVLLILTLASIIYGLVGAFNAELSEAGSDQPPDSNPAALGAVINSGFEDSTDSSGGGD